MLRSLTRARSSVGGALLFALALLAGCNDKPPPYIVIFHASGDGDAPRQLRCLDRMMDLYLINTVGGLLLRRIGVRTPDPMQDEKDRNWLNISYGWLDGQLAKQEYAGGDRFSIADCGAAAALFYAPEVASFDGFGNLKAYAKRLAERDSVRGVHAEMAQVWNAIKQRAGG